MDAESLAEYAVDLKQNHGHNCCQAVTAALASETGLDAETLNKLASGFAIGMGNMEATCGSLIGAVMAAGMKVQGQGTVRLSKQISEKFNALSGATICKTLKGKTDPAVFCPCDECVRNAVRAYCSVMEHHEKTRS
ncbi:MAG TPA: hypothetical protein DCZ74_04290 [Treponema sp.]|jgi:C_GCAxxG_C_C family probable redox protein|nr:hypothetical protein [Treponema sp.]